jgi:predicted RNA methylase
MSLSLQPDVRIVLERATWDGGVLKLPGEQLERKLYVAVNAALEALGGKWNRGKKGHVFASDAESRLRAMLASGVVPPKNPNAFFPTPPAVVMRIIELADFPEDEVVFVLEPSAGTGAIAGAVLHRYPCATIDCVEIDEDRVALLSKARGLRVSQADFLTWESDAGGYDRILMNPPFAVDGDATAWLAHVRRALGMLSPFGVLVSVVPSGFVHRNDRKHDTFRCQIAGRYEYYALPESSFKQSGTGVASGLLKILGEAVE